jgi:protein subunit release factor A
MIPPEELKYEVFSTQKPGGQQVGLVPAAVRVIHLPTGITASCNAARSQQRNREIVTDMILTALTHPRL